MRIAPSGAKPHARSSEASPRTGTAWRPGRLHDPRQAVAPVTGAGRRRRAPHTARLRVAGRVRSASVIDLGRSRTSRHEQLENPIERLELLAGDERAIADFLDELDVHSPREREMLTELARTLPVLEPGRFVSDHSRAVAALETLGRHGYHGSRVGRSLGPLRSVVRWAVQLVARYIVVSYLRDVATDLRNLYWLREMQTPRGTPERLMLYRARLEAEGMREIFKRRSIGVPSFVIGGLALPLIASIWRLADGFAFDRWWVALLVGLAGALVGVGISWVALRGTAMAGRRIRLTTGQPLRRLWDTIGACRSPPRDQSRTFAIVAIVLTLGVWIVLPTLVGIALATN
jgi:hypothetical protein